MGRKQILHMGQWRSHSLQNKGYKPEQILGKKCQIKISLVYDRNDIEKYKPHKDRNPTTMHENDKEPFIRNVNEYSEIIDEHVLWDFQPHGTQELEIDIAPKSSYLATIAKYHKNKVFHNGHTQENAELFDYFKILSENVDIPRVYLKHKKEYEIEIKILGENFMPTIKKATLKNITNQSS